MKEAYEKILERLEDVERILLNEAGDIGCTLGIINASEYAKQIVQEVAKEYNCGWIPIKLKPMTEEEKEILCKDIEYLTDENAFVYDCPLPKDKQEVLITSAFGTVDKTVFHTDFGCYFEDYECLDDVIAWQQLPEHYKE